MKQQAIQRPAWRIRLRHGWKAFDKGIILDAMVGLVLAVAGYALFVILLGWPA